MSDLVTVSPEDRVENSVTGSAIARKTGAGNRRWQGIVFWILTATVAFVVANLSPKTSFLVVVYLFALLQLAQANTWRKAFYPGLVVGLLIALAQLGFFWRIFSAGAIALWLVYALWIGLFVVMARVCLRALPRWTGWLVVPFVWTGLEYFRSELYYLRFSWLSPGYAFAAAGWGPVLKGLGTYGLGFVLMGVACVGAAWWKGCRVSRLPVGDAADYRLAAGDGRKAETPDVVPYKTPEVVSHNRARAVAVLFVGTGMVFVAGWLFERGSNEGTGTQVKVAGIQMEFPTESEVRVRLEELVRKHPETELVVLSEYTFNEPVPEKVKDWCRRSGRYLVVGGTAPAGNRNFYNTAFVVAPSGEIVFKQVKAVPIQFFKDGLQAPEQKVWDSPWGKIGICICYDLSYARVTDRLVKQGAEALIVPTMDVADWGEWQHKLHARVAPIRAAEYGIPIFRLASSGISQFVNSAGKVVARTQCFADGELLCGTLELKGAGKWPVDRWLGPFSTGATVMLMGWFLMRRRRSTGVQAPSSKETPDFKHQNIR